MKISELKKLFAGVLDVFSFKKIVNDEIMLYERLLGKTGSSIPIELVEDEKMFFGKNEFVFLCKAHLVGSLNKYEIAYISEAILLSSNVEIENDLIQEYLDLFSYLEDDERLSEEDIKIMIDRITSN